MPFACDVHRFWFEALDPLQFPALAANSLRGALGYLLSGDSQKALFRPSNVPGPSGLRDRTRPYALRAAPLNGAHIDPGGSFWFDIHLFAEAARHPQIFADAFQQLERTGLGRQRSRVRFQKTELPFEIRIDLPKHPAAELSNSDYTICFLTPTELKAAGTIAAKPYFDVLFARLLERITALQGSNDIAVAEWLRAAAQMELTGERTQVVSQFRRSARTGQRHPLGGIIGEATYRGDLPAFAPWLDAAYWCGVGRHTAWGNGVIRLMPAALTKGALRSEPAHGPE